MTAQGRQDTRRAAGMTLVELLVAIAIAVFIAAVALSVFYTVSGSIRRRQDQRWQAAVEALDAVRRDLTGCLPNADGGREALVLEPAEGVASTNPCSALLCVTAALPPDQQDFSRFEAWRVRYAVQPAAGGEAGAELVREAAALTGDARLEPPRKTVLMRRVTGFDVRVLAGSSWTNRWVPDLKRPLPQAAQIRLTWSQGSTNASLAVTVLVPAGHVIAPAGRQGTGAATPADAQAPRRRPAGPPAP
jgi:type II secretion system protein J